jgi:beta-mannosidase
MRDGVLCDEKDIRFGVRSVELIRTSTTDENGNGEFLFKINGKKIFCLGTNWVPLDAFHSRDLERLAPALEMIDDIGCNMIRCWGGNVYENDAFYEYCDEHGIMIWQDFGMGCGVYPQDACFAEKLRVEAVAVIKRLRQHASLILWAGDNEVDVFSASDGFRRNPNHNILTRQILPQALRENDLVRPYLPSSPYVDEEAFQTRKPTSEEHLWGPRDYFKGNYYGTSKCHFASETGYHGCPSPKSLEKFISKEMHLRLEKVYFVM